MRIRSTLLVIAAWGGLLAACASPAAPTPAPTSAPTATPSPSFPVTVSNCGRELTFDKAPERVVSMWQPETEMLLALGVQDKLVGVAGNYAPYPEAWQALADKFNVIGEIMTWPPREVTLSLKPDFVISELLEGMAFDGSLGYATVAELEAAGAKVYSSNACTMMDISGKRIENVYTDLGNLGKIFGVSAKAESIMQELQARQASVESSVAGLDKLKTAFYNGGEGPINILAGGVYGDIIERAGGQNVFAPELFSVSVEEFAAAQPDVILVGYYPGQEVDASIAFLKKTFPNVPAVINNRFIPVADITIEASVRVVDALEVIAKGLHPEAFK